MEDCAMNARTLARWPQRFSWLLSRLPMRQPGIVVLCVAACAIMAVRAHQLHVEVAQATSALRYQAAAMAAPANAASDNHAAQMLAFFPAQAPTEDFLKRLYVEAEKRRINITQVSVEAGTAPLPTLHRENIRVSLVAQDDGYRELIYTLLAKMPSMALTRMSVSRTDLGDFQVDLLWGSFSR